MDIDWIHWTGKFYYVDLFPFMGTPYPLIVLFALYLLYVLKIGPQMMKTREAYNLSELIRVYNVFQVITCIYIVFSAHYYYGYSFLSFTKCIKSPPGIVDGELVPKSMIVYSIGFYLFMSLRMLELVETVFFVLRKKFNQVSTLHVYHHISTIVLCWLFLKYRGGTMETFIAVINSYVHIIMYGYYFISSFPKFRSVTNKIKPYITLMQIIQLVMIFVQCVAIYNCEDSILNYILLGNFAVNIILFTHFYLKTYGIGCKGRGRKELNNNREAVREEAGKALEV